MKNYTSALPPSTVYKTGDHETVPVFSFSFASIHFESVTAQASELAK